MDKNYNSSESSASTHICKLPSRYNLAYSKGSSTANEVSAHSDPVSYTHLDVYKRQELSELLNILPNTEELLSKMEEQKTKIELLENEKDVYKRQSFMLGVLSLWNGQQAIPFRPTWIP